MPDKLRQRAEEIAEVKEAKLDHMLSSEETRLALHELQVHQIELEMQNDELRRTQIELENSREQYFDLYNLAPVGYVTLDETGMIREANLTIANMLGVTRSQLLKRFISGFVENDDTGKFYLFLKKITKSHEPKECEIRLVDISGRHLWVHMQTTATHNASGELFIRAALSDITERKRAEDLLQESENRFRLLFDNAPLPYQSLNEHGFFLDVNQKWLDVLGYQKEEVIGRWFGDFLGDGYAEHFDLNFPMFKDACAIDGVEFNMLTKNRDTIRVSFNGRVQLDTNGVFSRTHCIFSDITERNKADKLREEIDRIIQHDLRAPAGAAITVAKLLSNSRNLNDEDRELLKCLQHSGQRMLDTLSQSLTIYKIHTGQYQCEKTKIDMIVLIGEILNQLHAIPQFSKYSTELVSNGVPVGDGGLPCCLSGDSHIMRLSLQNLIQNAMEASPHDSAVIITLTYNCKCTIEILNKGVVPKEIRDRFFEKYVTAGKTFGTGIGTYSAKIMIEAQGGSIEMQTSDARNETVITIHMPA